MNVLMIGNGFDLYHNLLTSYNDFIVIIKTFRKRCVICDFENISICSILKDLKKDSIQNSISIYKDAYLKTTMSCEEYCEFARLSSNSWFRYFEEIEAREGWVYLETQISEVLKKIRTNNTCGMSVFFEVFKEKSGLSDAQLKHVDKYVVNKQENDSILFNEFDDFVKLLRLYIKIFVDRVMCNISKLYRFENGFLQNCEYVISFNYTNTYKQLYDSDANIINIHGKVDNEIILGINSDGDDDIGSKDVRFIKYKKYYQRITKHTLTGLRKIMSLLKLTTQIKHLKVIGHSLNDTDEDIITVIFGLFDYITIYYHDDVALDTYVKNLKQIYGAKTLSEMTFSQKIVFEKLPEIQYKRSNLI